MLTAGSVDVMVEVVCEGDSHLLEILGKIRAIPSVRATETFVYLKLHKADVLMGHPVTAPA